MQPATPVPPTPEQMARLHELAGGGEEGDRLVHELRNLEMWRNGLYVVTVTRREDGSVAELSIRREDRKAPRDWRHFQRIKTEIAGADVEAVELYPAEDRLMDTANQFYLWCLSPGERFPLGFNLPRNLRDDDPVLGDNNRPLPQDWKDLDVAAQSASSEREGEASEGLDQQDHAR